MTRKTTSVTFGEDAGRDAGKTYVITEMSAAQAEDWAWRALLALGHAGFVMPDGLEAAGMAAMAVVGINSLINIQWAEAKPLLDEMIGCVQFKPSEEAQVRPLFADDIEEVSTRVRLRKAVWDLHVDFSAAAALLKALATTATMTSQGSSIIPTSQG